MRTYQEFAIDYFQDEDGVFTARVPAIKGCIAWGESLEEAYHNAVDAIESAWKCVRTGCHRPGWTVTSPKPASALL